MQTPLQRFIQAFTEITTLYNIILWLDKSKIDHFGNNSACPFWKGCTYEPKSTKPTLKYGGRSIMVWGKWYRAITGHRRQHEQCGWEIIKETLIPLAKIN